MCSRRGSGETHNRTSPPRPERKPGCPSRRSAVPHTVTTPCCSSWAFTEESTQASGPMPPGAHSVRMTLSSPTPSPMWGAHLLCSSWPLSPQGNRQVGVGLKKGPFEESKEGQWGLPRLRPCGHRALTLPRWPQCLRWSDWDVARPCCPHLHEDGVGSQPTRASR